MIDLLEAIMCSEFLGLIDFILEFRGEILSGPIYGQVKVIGNMFEKYLRGQATFDKLTGPSFVSFKSFLDELNNISDNSLSFEHGSIPENYLQPISFSHFSPRLTWIDIPKLIILRDRLNGRAASELKFKYSQAIDVKDYDSANDCLISILNQPIFTEIKLDFTNGSAIDNTLVANFTILDDLLKKDVASYSLSREKAVFRTMKKGLPKVCEDICHYNFLTKICFSEKDGPCRLIPAPLKNVYHKIEQRLPTMNKELVNCIKSNTHYLPVLNSHTDLSLGDCSYLDTCHKTKTCRYLHYLTLKPISLEDENADSEKYMNLEYTLGECFAEYITPVAPAQWINCDVRQIPFSVLGKFAAILMDPAWDIHMSLPFGTCKDTELLSLPMHELQDEGIILLWVTGRSIEVGRTALTSWGYTCSDEIIWVKLNQLKRTIVTGRTGHWLNHSKEHLLVGVKGNPIWLNRRLDSDVIVSGTRETSRKPDELYDIVERLVGPHARKLEIFGRDHNIRKGWFTIGDQVLGTQIIEQEVNEKYERYLEQKKNEGLVPFPDK